MREISDVKELQQVLLELLAWFKAFCEAHELTFFLSNGTLLGAAKYQGFVPWDDDVDIIMPRADYDRLVRMTEIRGGRYRLLCCETTPGWRLPYAKLSDTRTFVQESDYDFGAEIGAFLDIFPIDRWHPNRAVAAVQAVSSEVLKRVLVFANAGSFHTERRGVKRWILFALWTAGRCMGYERLCRKILRRADRSRAYPEKLVGCVVWTSHLTREIVPASVFAGGETLTFCGEAYPVPVGYAMYLDRLYGCWREDPPAARQKSNHTIRVWWKEEEGGSCEEGHDGSGC